MQKLKEKKLSIIVLALLTAALLAVTVWWCGVLSHNHTGKHGTLYVDGMLAGYTVSDLFQDASVIAEGTITGKGDAFQIQSMDGGIANFTDYQLQITSVSRGEVAVNDTVAVRLNGGTVGDYTEIYAGQPDFTIGDSYLLFLYQPGYGTAYNTEGDYYYVVGLCQGVFVQNQGQYVSQSGDTLTGKDMVELASDTAFMTSADYRQEFIDNQKSNLENGIITQEEYDEWTGSMDQYATILP